MINVKVDMNLCQNYGLCTFEAPNVFELNSDDKLEYRSPVDDSERTNVEGAIGICPMQAISFG